MKTISLGNGRFALVDDEDFEWLSKTRWHCSCTRLKGRPGIWYAKNSNGFMHREIMRRHGIYSKQYDHIDGNGLNNQKPNIRQSTQSQNNANRKKEPNCSSRFKGVSWWASKRRWIAQVRKNGKRIYIGSFTEEEKAARAYDENLRENFGWFALTNFL